MNASTDKQTATIYPLFSVKPAAKIEPKELNLERGRKIYCGLYGGTYKVITHFTPGSQPVRHLGGGCIGTGGGQVEYVQLGDSPHKSTVPEAIVRGVQWRILNEIVPESEIVELEEQALQIQKAALTADEERRKRDEEAKARGLAILKEKAPSWAKAAIIASLVQDQSDFYSDYHGSTTQRQVIIGWSKHTRDLFPEMRKAASACGMDELKHLGPGCDRWQARLVWNHDSSDTEKKEASFISGYDQHYYKGQSIAMLLNADHHQKSPVFYTEAEVNEWLNDKTAPAGTEYRKTCESFEHREKYSMGGGYYLKDGWRDSDGWKVSKTTIYKLENLASIAGSKDGYMVPETAQKRAKQTKPAKKASEATSNAPGVVVSLNEKKNGVQIHFPGIPAAEIREEMKGEGWRWSRFNKCWYQRNNDKNLEFAHNLASRLNGTENKELAPIKPNQASSASNPAPAKKVNQAAKLRTLANNLQSQIDNKLADRQTNTPKRMAQAAHSRLEGEKLQRTQAALLALADLHEAGSVPDILSRFINKKSIYDLMTTKKEPVQNGFHQYSRCTGEPLHTTPEAVALWSLFEGKTEEQKKAEALKLKIDSLQFSNIPGFFPTPNNIIDKMIEYARIEATDRVLEPELGSCAIADRAKPLCAEVKGFEINCTLADIAEEKDYLIEQRDFLTVEWEEITQYEKILMNPPFENKADIKHIKHAIQFLKPGGTLVAICANGPNQQRELQPICTHWEDLPQGSFKESGTGVSTALIVIEA